MRRAILLLIALGLAVFGAASSASAAKRVALVIGIDAYDNLPTLQKAVNDQKAVGDALAGLGFDVVSGENLTRREMNAKLAELDAKIAPGDTVFFYFAGHGVALGAENYLLPRDLPKPNEGEENLVRDEGYPVDTIVRRVQGRGAAISFFVLDACRDNPIAASGVRSIGGTRGLTRVDAPKGVFVLFSAGMGQTALDRLGDTDPDPNSVFTRKLVPLMKTPGLTHLALAKRVQQQVDELAATVRHPQQPAYYDQIIGEIELSPAMVAPGAPLQSAPAEVKTLASEPETQVAVVTPPPAPKAPSKPVEPAVVTVPKPPTGQYKPGDTFKDCHDCPEMVVIPAGEFVMGSIRYFEERPLHDVRIGSPFAIGKFEVTKDEFEAFVTDSNYDAGSKCFTTEGGASKEREGRSFRNPGFTQLGSEPASCISWDDAKAYVDWLSKRTGMAYHLPSEEQWEYAARAGDTMRLASATGDDVCKYANGEDFTTREVAKGLTGVEGCSDGYANTSPVGKFLANDFGLYDMQGNVSEWTEDCWSEGYSGAYSDGSAWTRGDCSKRVFRGGSWKPGTLRLAARRGARADLRFDAQGFRVARSLQ